MKGYYLFAPVEPENAGPDSGVEKKVRAQHKALSKYVDCELIILPPVQYKGTAAEKITRRLPFTAAWRKWKYSGEFDDADFLYIRQVYHDSSFIRYLAAIKKSNPKIKIIYEIPTYPYDSETTVSLSNFVFTVKERTSRKMLKKYVDRIVTFYNQKEIFGVPCLDLINGYDFDQIEIPNREKTGNIELMSVSATAVWHGYDRIIEGLHNYYSNGGTENIIYHLVGNIIPQHKELVDKYNLQEHVILHGKMFGQELQEIYKRSFIGFDVLGGHRKDYPVSSSLKSREYAASGLPLVTSSPVDYLPEDYKYQLLVPYDDSPLDICRLLEFYHNIYDENECISVAREIRSYAKNLCNMDAAMKPVIDYVKD